MECSVVNDDNLKSIPHSLDTYFQSISDAFFSDNKNLSLAARRILSEYTSHTPGSLLELDPTPWRKFQGVHQRKCRCYIVQKPPQFYHQNFSDS